MTGPSASSTAGDRERRRSGRDKDKSRRAREGRPGPLGMTAAAEGQQPPPSSTPTPTVAVASAEDGATPATVVVGVPSPMHLPVVTAGGTEVAQIPAGPPTPPAAGGSAQARPWDGPGISDDASVLPVPSHVVLHHLSTSAIRNGVLAVANTTRYRKKVGAREAASRGSGEHVLTQYVQYITTIYYKPT